MSRRRLSPDELDLWSRVARSAQRMDNRDYFAPKGPAPKPPLPRDTARSEPVSRFSLGEAAPRKSETWSPPATTSEQLRNQPVKMDAKAFQRLKRGKLVPEARIDLHGMTLDRAHPALIRFILTSHSRGLRLVLVITGKGTREDPYDPAPRRRGVLKSQVPQWLRMPPLAPLILQVSEAHIRHGGAGAYYVYLKRGSAS
ncbi:Smr/MutS family protein [Litorisediminicola beolgyonensis]|uniref:Smr/MutS family protein n=1 Tax=Litorisediminicola beolgyonensis TaxID=1173614 RepID=A0ABW3ZEQ1_9RHOB